MVEQGTHKPLDVGSNPTLATTYLTHWHILIEYGWSFGMIFQLEEQFDLR